MAFFIFGSGIDVTKNEDMAIAAFGLLAQKAEPKLAAALAAHGVTSPSQLAPDVAKKIFADAVITTAVESFPDARLDVLRHIMTAWQHPLFGEAFSKLRAALDAPNDAFAPASGPDAAIFLAGLGLLVAPFDRKAPRLLAEPSKDIEVVARNFARWKTAYVGYSPCEIPFYMLFTDCVRTMWPQIVSNPHLQEVRCLIERTGAGLPQRSLVAFQHGIILIAREPSDTISTVFLENPNANAGSVALYAGWTVNGQRHGAPNDGFLPVPMQFLEAALKDQQFAMWLWRPVGLRVALN